MDATRGFEFRYVIFVISFMAGIWTVPTGLAAAEGDEASPPSAEEGPTDAAPRRADELNVPSGVSDRAPSTELDALLQLPSGYSGQRSSPTVAGASESEWRRRFRDHRERLDTALATLEATKNALDMAADGSAGAQWNVAPPGMGGADGGGSSTSPLSFKLRQQLKENRLDVDDAKKKLRELEIEANLAGVPREWRGTSGSRDEPPSEVGQLLD